MAYNPFNIFRRNQKAIFAVITVFIMFTFVLSSGLGGGADFFDWLPQWLGKKSRKGDVVCTIDGNKVYSGELDQLRFQRAMANRYMSLATDLTVGTDPDGRPLGTGGLDQYIEDRRSDVSADHWRILTQGPGAVMESQQPNLLELLVERMMRDPQMRGLPRDLALQLANNQASQIRQTANQYTQLLNSSTLTEPEAKLVQAVDALQALVGIQRAQRQTQRGDRLYFLNAPNNSQRDLINFMLWQKKADQLGIRFTTDDVKKLIQREFFGMFSYDVIARQSLQKEMHGFNMEACYRAIGEEFRVRTAQIAAFGSGAHGGRGDKTFGGPPLFTPPVEVYEYYRDRVSPTTYNVIAIPAANFVDRVSAEPTESELASLYSRYQNSLPDPSKPTPGFMEPRKLKLGWLSVTGTEPYYIKLAEEEYKAATGYQMQTEAMLTIPLPGVGPGWAGMALVPFAAPDMLLGNLYTQQTEFDHYNHLNRDWTFNPRNTFGPALQPLDTSVVRAPNLGVASGGIGGGLVGFAGPLPGICLLESAAWAYETRDRLKASLPGMLAIMPGPGIMGPEIAAEVSFRASLPKPIPLAAVRAQLLKKYLETSAQQLVREDLSSLQEAMFEGGYKVLGFPIIGKKEYLTLFANQRGLKIGNSKELRDEWTLEEDPGLAELKAAYDRTIKNTFHGNLPVRFGKQFFWNDFQEPAPANPATGDYQPVFYPERPAPPGLSSPEAAPKPILMAWRTEEVGAKAGNNFQADRAKVRAAWKRERARDQAKAEAEALAARINALNPEEAKSPVVLSGLLTDLENQVKAQWATDPKAQERIRSFRIGEVAPLAPIPLLEVRNPSAMGALGTFWPLHPLTRLPRGTSDIPFPTAEMRTALLDHRKDPEKTSFVLWDRPKDTYYVVTVLQRGEKSLDTFRDNVYLPLSRNLAPERDSVLGNHRIEAQNQMVESITGLLKKEFKYEETEDQKKRLDENEKRGES